MFDWITGFIQRTGYVGILAMMFAENMFPPIPSELIMPMAGYTSASGSLNFFVVVAAGTVGSILGALFWFWVGRKIGADRLKSFAQRHGRWLTLSPAEIDQADAWFDRHGPKAVFLGRLIPAVRTLISVPAGISGMPLVQFLAWTTLGTLIWTTLLAGAGYLLQDQYMLVSRWMNPVSNVVIGIIAAWYIYRVVTFQPGPVRDDPRA